MQRITYQEANGDWGIKGVKLEELPPQLYGAVYKLLDYENTGFEPSDVKRLADSVEELLPIATELKAMTN